VVCVVLVVCTAVKTGVEDVSNMLLCAGSWLRVCCFDRGVLKNYVLHCHGFVLHTGSPVRCILPLHCFIVLNPVLFACEGKCNCMVASFWPFPCHLQVVSELVYCGSFRFLIGRGFFMTDGVSQVCQRSCWGR
jgi:hypothetical protein